MLVGGVQSVTLGDEEASRRGVQKTVLERKGPSTFNCGVEIISKTELCVHCDLEATVDAFLSGRNPRFEVRKLNEELDEKKSSVLSFDSSEIIGESGSVDIYKMHDDIPCNGKAVSEENYCKDEHTLCLFLYGIPETSMLQGMKQLKLDESIELLTTSAKQMCYLHCSPSSKRILGFNLPPGLAAYLLMSPSSSTQLTKAIQTLMDDYADGFDFYESEAKANESEKTDALEEARIAIEQVVNPKGEHVDLLPRPSNVLLLQKDLIRKYKLKSERIVFESGDQLRVLPFHLTTIEEDSSESEDAVDEVGEFEKSYSLNDVTNGSAFTVDKFPLLPD